MMVGSLPHALHLQFGELTIDLAGYRVLLAGCPLALSYRDYALLAYLAGRAGHVVSKRQLLEEGLGRHDAGGLREVEERLRHLKGIVERAPGAQIEESEQGYRFIYASSSSPNLSIS